MGSKLRQTQDAKKATFKKNLEARVALLISRGIDQKRIDKDTIVRKLKADLDAVKVRLAAIDAIEKKTADLAAAKAAKAAALKAAAEPVKEEKVAPKEKKEKKEKKAKEGAPAEAKEKKPKKEKAEKEKAE